MKSVCHYNIKHRMDQGNKIIVYQLNILHKISQVVTESKPLADTPCVSTTSFFFVLPLLELSQLTW